MARKYKRWQDSDHRKRAQAGKKGHEKREINIKNDGFWETFKDC